MRSIGIVGNDLTGLACALACEQVAAGEITLYNTTNHTDPNSGVILPPNATKIFHALGLKEALENLACDPSMNVLRSYRQGFAIEQLPLGKFFEARYGASLYTVHRGDLLALLQTAITASAVELRSTTRVQAVDERGTLLLEDQTTQQHDLVIHTVPMAQDAGAETVAGVATEYQSVSGLLETSALDSRVLQDQLTTWLAPNSHLICYPTNRSEQLAYCYIRNTKQGSEKASFLKSATELWQSAAMPFLDSALAQFEVEPELGRFMLFDTDTPMHLASSVYLASATQTQHGFAEAIAFEDAWVLARMLQTYDDQIAEGLANYQRYRGSRRKQYTHKTLEQFAFLQMDNTLVRNLKLGLANRFLPEMAMGKYDWYYDYDCIKGFD